MRSLGPLSGVHLVSPTLRRLEILISYFGIPLLEPFGLGEQVRQVLELLLVFPVLESSTALLQSLVLLRGDSRLPEEVLEVERAFFAARLQLLGVTGSRKLFW